MRTDEEQRDLQTGFVLLRWTLKVVVVKLKKKCFYLFPHKSPRGSYTSPLSFGMQ